MFHTRTVLLVLIVALVLSFSGYAQDAPTPAPVTIEIVEQRHVD